MHLGALGIMGETATRHMIRVWLPRQSAPEKHSQEKKPTFLCAPREFHKQYIYHV